MRQQIADGDARPRDLGSHCYRAVDRAFADQNLHRQPQRRIHAGANAIQPHTVLYGWLVDEAGGFVSDAGLAR